MNKILPLILITTLAAIALYTFNRSSAQKKAASSVHSPNRKNNKKTTSKEDNKKVTLEIYSMVDTDDNIEPKQTIDSLSSRYYQALAIEGEKEKLDAIVLFIGLIKTSEIKEAVELWGNLPRGIERNTLLHKIIQLWVPKNARNCAVWVLRLEDSDLKGGLSYLAEQWVLYDPKQASQWGLTLEPSLSLFYFNIIAKIWSTTDFNSSLSFFMMQKDSSIRALGFSILVLRKAATDIDGSLKLLIQYPESVTKKVQRNLALLWSRKSPRAAIEWVLQFEDKAFVSKLTQSILITWASLSPIQALHYLEAIKDLANLEKVKSHIYKAWMTKSPKEATHYISQLNDSTEIKNVITPIMSTLALHDKAFAQEILQELKPDAALNIELVNASRALLRRSPEEAISFIEDLPSQYGKTNMIINMANDWSVKEPQKAANWILNKTATSSKELSIGLVMKNWVKSDQKGYLSWANNIQDEAIKTSAFKSISKEVTAVNPERGADIILKIQNSNTQIASLKQTIPIMLQNDLNKTIAFIEKLPPKSKDYGYFYLVKSHINKRPLQSLEFAQKIDQLPILHNAATLICYHLKRTNPQKARDWVATLPLESKDILALQKIINNK